MKIKLFTIGFTQRSARDFFEKLQEAGVKRVIDVRLNNKSQLAGFAKRDDLAFFLKEMAAIDYVHLTELAPDQPMLDAYRKERGAWEAYEQNFLELLRRRKVEETLKPEMFRDACLLCSEHQPHHCHRRLVAEYLEKEWGGVVTKHLI